MHPLLKRTAGFVKKKGLLHKGDKVLIALSGGADSVFLFRFLLELKGIYHLELGAAHLNHGLRGSDSDADEEFCRMLAVEYEVPFYCRKADVRDYASDFRLSEEEAGRKLRYQFFEELMEHDGYTKTATGHHQQDSAETVLFHLFRGSGLRGLSGIPPLRGRFIRPLLSLTPGEIREWLASEGYIWREDASNDSSEYARNVIRNEILPLVREKLHLSPEESLSRFAGYSSEINDLLDRLTAEAVLPRKEHSENETVYDAEVVRKLEPVLRKHALSRILTKSGTEPASSLVTDCDRLIESAETGVYQIGGGFSLFYSPKDVIIFRETENSEKEVRISPGESVIFAGKEISFERVKKEDTDFSGSPRTEFIESANEITMISVRHWHAGDRFQPLGMKGTVLVSDFLNSAGIPLYKKKQEAVIIAGGEIAAIAGRRLSEKFKVTGSENFYYRIQCHER